MVCASVLENLQVRKRCLDTDCKIEPGQTKAIKEGFCQLLINHLGKYQDNLEELSPTDLYHCAKVLELLLSQGTTLYTKNKNICLTCL